MNVKSIKNIYQIIQPYLKNIPLQFSERLSEKYQANIFLKREDLQFTRSFKIRGALYKILKEYKSNPQLKVVCASAGNHAQGVAFACQLLNIQGDIFIPDVTPLQKINRIKFFGKESINLHIQGNKLTESIQKSIIFSQENNSTFIHPFDDIDIILGQGTIGYEISQELIPDIVISSIGGGGLISGLSQSLDSNLTTIIGAEPQGAASMSQAIKNGKPTYLEFVDTFVDGASVQKIGESNFEICKKVLNYEHSIKLISNEHISHELINTYQDDGIILEPAGVLSICALDKIPRQMLQGKNVVCVLSGGNNDITRYPEIIEKNLLYLNRKHYYIIEFPQKPKQLKKYILQVLGETDDITRFEYIKKTNTSFGKVLLGIETKENNIVEDKMKLYNFKFDKIEPSDLIYSYLI